MKKINLFILWYPSIILFLLITGASVNAEDQKDGIHKYLVIGSGFESLSYTEYEPETGSYTDITLNNVVTKFEGIMTLNDVFFSVKWIFPVSLGKEREKWERSGDIYQTNSLKYAWTRLAGNVGYSLYPWLNPYLGFRWTESEQERGNFFLSAPVDGESIETNKALFASAGLKGILKSSSRWQFRYSLEYFLPVYSRTENTALTGWKSSEKDGYSFGANTVAEYIYSPSLSLIVELAAEKSSWDGSGWIDYTEGSAKWPKNETISLNCILGLAWTF